MKHTPRPKGQCTTCGREATHCHECQPCHVETLVITAVKGKYRPDELIPFCNDFIDADLFKTANDLGRDPVVRYIASIAVRLSLANGMLVKDVQRRVVRRLEIEAEAEAQKTPEQKEDWKSRIVEAMGHLTNHFRTAKP